MSYLYVCLAGLLEVVWALSLKASQGFTKAGPSAVALIGAPLSFVLLSLGMKGLPAGTAYAAWTGIGAAGTAILGMIFYGEPRDLPRIACIALILAGTLGLRFLGRLG